MHEYSIVAALLEKVEAEAAVRHASSVHRLHLSIGALAGVEIDLLRTAFETFRAGTLCDGAELAITPVEASWACPGCGASPGEGAALRCTTCSLPVRLERGGEILLDRIEMEVPDV